jgi:cytochrome oxidase Cu insertion factor (SCO1/SenC/PrrC family)
LVLNAGLGVALIAALTLVWLSLSRGGTQAAPSAPASTQTPFTFAPHHRRAAAFRLTDQGGRPVSLTAYRGRPVIVTFIDPLCRNLCPLAAHVLNQLDRQLPPARRVPIIAVSVDVYADSRADLIQDYSRWRLVPQWHWAVGTPARLAAVWRSYGIGVQVVTKRIAGTTVHFIYHDEVAYVVDPEGYARALFFWPYDAAGIERTLAEVARA